VVAQVVAVVEQPLPEVVEVEVVEQPAQELAQVVAL
jgi:hypothetical protein